MKNLYSVSSLIVISSMLFACSSSDSANEHSNSTETNSVSDEEMVEGNSNPDIEDQLNLNIGDTAKINTTISTYEVTLNEIKRIDELEGDVSEADFFLLTEYNIKNVGNENVDISEAISALEATDMLDVTGEKNIAGGFESLHSLQGELKNGEEATGNGLYYAYDADEYYIKVTDGLVSSGGIKNQILFTVQRDEIE